MIPKNKNIKTLYEKDLKTGKIEPVVTKPLIECEHWKESLEAETIKNNTKKEYFIK